MKVEVSEGVLVDLVSEQAKKMEEIAADVRVNNVLTLAGLMGLDPLEPVARAKVLRHMEALESAVKSSD